LEMRVSVRDGGVTSAAAVAQMMMHVLVCRIVLTTQLSISNRCVDLCDCDCSS